MRIVRIAYQRRTSYGILDGGQVRLLRGAPFSGIRESGERLRLSEVRLLAPSTPVNYWGVGFNYPSHLAQAQATSGQDIPTMPRPWHKGVGSMVGPEEPIIIPPEAKEVHYEGELVIVIGKKARRITAEQASQHILGYTCGNDVSEKASWEREGTMWRAKGTDTFGPVGPWIETDLNPHNQELTVRLNGRVENRTHTSEMIHTVYALVSYMSQFTTLSPGDLILTGAAGTTRAMKPGDVVEVEVSGIGVLRNPVQAEKLR
ncbi:MAG: fumarylacetoacetate hydrolase family protein [Chloroflexi bacterium]|nr:fumarylacetoacetate hydrolase family protein [Chloroflexota bacterium]